MSSERRMCKKKEEERFHDVAVLDEQHTMELLHSVGEELRKLYGRIIRTHTMAAAGNMTEETLSSAIGTVKADGRDIAERLRKVADLVEKTVGCTEAHLLRHLVQAEKRR